MPQCQQADRVLSIVVMEARVEREMANTKKPKLHLLLIKKQQMILKQLLKELNLNLYQVSLIMFIKEQKNGVMHRI